MLDLPDTNPLSERLFRMASLFLIVGLLVVTAGNRLSHAMAEMRP